MNMNKKLVKISKNIARLEHFSLFLGSWLVIWNLCEKWSSSDYFWFWKEYIL